ncbi:MAG: hypothetical protein LBL00_05395, partial [Endomicrobium sp.]|nr:hypothetical protein [Endomicrobium sp.]
MSFKKLISLFTVLCFLTTFAGQNLSWAASSGKVSAEEFKKIFENIPKIPSQYGKVTAVSNTGSKTIVVNIQDLHCHPEAQKNISKIIEILDKNYKVRNIYVEGAYDKVDISWLADIQDKSFRDSLILQMVEEGRLNASEYYSVKNGKKDFLLGLEDRQKHEENIKRLGYILSRQEQYAQTLERIQKNVNYWDAKYANARNKRFNRTLEKYRKSEISSEKFYAILCKYANKINADPQKYNNVLPIKISNYPNIQNFLFMTKASAELDMKKVQVQMQTVLAYLKERLPMAAFQIFLDETDNLSNIDSLSAALSNFGKTFDIDLDINYKHLNAFFKLQELSGEINPLELIAEERHLTERLRAALSYDQTEIEISFLNDFSGYFKDYLQNKLMADDFAYFDSRFDKFRELYSKYAVINDLKEVERDFELLNTYYKLNDKRNDIFAENIFKECIADETVTEEPVTASNDPNNIFKNAEEIIIAVTGGYHSYGLKELLAKKGITDIVITPTITEGIERAEFIYEEIMKQQSEFLREALAFTIASQAGEQEQFELFVQVGISLLKNTKYTSGNIDELIKFIKTSVHNRDVGFEQLNDETIMKFRDGKTIVLEKNEKGLISLKNGGAVFEQKKAPARIKKITPQLMEQVILSLPSIHDLSALVPDIDGLLNRFIEFAEKNELHNFFNGDGLIPELSNFDDDPNITIYGIHLTTLAKLPPQIQKAFVNANNRQQQIQPTPAAAVQQQPETPAQASPAENAQVQPQKKQSPEAAPVSKAVPRAGNLLKRFFFSILLALSLVTASGCGTDIPEIQTTEQSGINSEREQITQQDDTDSESDQTLINTEKLPLDKIRDALRNSGDLYGNEALEDDNIAESVEYSNRKEIQDLVKAAYDKLEANGIKFKQRFPVLFLNKFESDDFAAACLDAGFMVVPSGANFDKKTDKEKEEFLLVKIAHEGTHLNNIGRAISTIEDEAEAYAATAEALKIAGKTGDQLKYQQYVADAFKFIVNNKSLIMQPINFYENITFADLNYFEIQIAPTDKTLSDETVVVELHNNDGRPYSYYFKINTQTQRIDEVRILNRATEKNDIFVYDFYDNSALELPETAAEADAKNLKGIKRAFFVARKEFEKTLLSDFVDMHYGKEGPTGVDKISDAYRMRVRGDRIIKTATKIATAICSGRITKLVRAVNITTHAIFNLLQNKSKQQLFKIPEEILTDMSFLEDDIRESVNNRQLQDMLAQAKRDERVKDIDEKIRYDKRPFEIVLTDLPANKKFISVVKNDPFNNNKDTIELNNADGIYNGAITYKGRKYLFVSSSEFTKLKENEKKDFLVTLLSDSGFAGELSGNREIVSVPSYRQFARIILDFYSRTVNRKSSAMYMLKTFTGAGSIQYDIVTAQNMVIDNLPILSEIFPKRTQGIFPDKQAYVKIISERNNEEYLRAAVQNEALELEQRILAYTYLTATGYDTQRDELHSKILQNVQNLAGKTIQDDFDLRIALTAAWELATSKSPVFREVRYAKDSKGRSVYDKITRAGKLTGVIDQNANHNFMMDIVDFYVLLHEMGHNLLERLFPDLDSRNVQIAALHEVFAYATSEANDTLNEYKSKPFEEKYGIDETSGIAIYGEAHLDAKVFLNKLYGQDQNAINWELLQLSVIEYIEEIKSKKIENYINSEKLLDIYNDKITKNIRIDGTAESLNKLGNSAETDDKNKKEGSKKSGFSLFARAWAMIIKSLAIIMLFIALAGTSFAQNVSDKEPQKTELTDTASPKTEIKIFTLKEVMKILKEHDAESLFPEADLIKDIEYSNSKTARDSVERVYNFFDNNGITERLGLTQRYPVLFLSSLDKADIHGIAQSKDGYIVVDRSLSFEHQILIYLHELIHIINKSKKLGSIEDEFLARNIYKIFADLFPEEKEIIKEHGEIAKVLEMLIKNEADFNKMVGKKLNDFVITYIGSQEASANFAYNGIHTLDLEKYEIAVVELFYKYVVKQQRLLYYVYMDMNGDLKTISIKYPSKMDITYMTINENGKTVQMDWKSKILPSISEGEEIEVSLPRKNITFRAAKDDNGNFYIKDTDKLDKSGVEARIEYDYGDNWYICLPSSERVKVKVVPAETADQNIPTTTESNARLQLPILTRIYDLLGIDSLSKQAEITSKVERPFILLATIFPRFAGVFIKWHHYEDADAKAALSGLQKITAAVREAYGRSYIREADGKSAAKETDKKAYDLVSIVINFRLKIKNAWDESRIRHRDFNYNNHRINIIYHNVKSEELESVNAAALTEEGYVNVPVYVINDMPENYNDWNFEPTAVKDIYVSKAKGAIVIYAKAERDTIIQELTSNRIISEFIRQAAQTATKINLKNSLAEVIEIDRLNADSGITYSENGNIRVGYKLYEEISKEEDAEGSFMSGLREIKKKDAFTFAQGIFHNLDDVVEISDFFEYLDVQQKIGNGQIVISTKLAQKIIEAKGLKNFNGFLNAARKDGVQLFLDSSRESADFDIEKAGFAGYIYKNEDDKIYIHNYALGTDIQLGTLEEGIYTSEALGEA